MRTANRIVSILDALDGNGTLNLADVSEASGLDRSTTLRILRSLESHGFVRRDSDGTYGLGLRLFDLAMRFVREYDLRVIARPWMEELTEKTQKTSFLLVRADLEALCVEKISTTGPIRVEFMGVGDKVPLMVGAGPKVLLAFQKHASEDLIEHLTKDWSARRRRELVNELATIRKKGTTVSKAYPMPGTLALGAPVRNGQEHAIGALSVAGIEHEFRGKRLPTMLNLLRASADHISEAMGREKFLNEG